MLKIVKCFEIFSISVAPLCFLLSFLLLFTGNQLCRSKNSLYNNRNDPQISLKINDCSSHGLAAQYLSFYLYPQFFLSPAFVLYYFQALYFQNQWQLAHCTVPECKIAIRILFNEGGFAMRKTVGINSR